MQRYMRFARATRQDHVVPGLHTRVAALQQPLLQLDDALAQAEAAEEGARLLRLDHELASARCQRPRILTLRGEHAEAEPAAIESDLHATGLASRTDLPASAVRAARSRAEVLLARKRAYERGADRH